jgi:hypothetical protein
MHPLLLPFITLEVPVLFIFAASVIFLRQRHPQQWLSMLLIFEFPLVAAGGVGLPLWLACQVLLAR